MPEGVVTSVSSRSVQVAVGDETLRATLRGNLWNADRDETRPVAVGDRVRVTVDGGSAVIEEVLPRSNRFARLQPFGRFSGKGRAGRHGRNPPVQVIAANIDRMLVVAAMVDPPFRAGLVDRFCVAAAAQGIEAQVVLNKVDLPGERPDLSPWRQAGLVVHETSAGTGEGIEGLAAEMAAGISLLVGHSGVGKSSLLNAVDPDLELATGSVTGFHGRGRHTTTRVSLVPMSNGGWVVDSPGIRELALESVTPPDLARLFPGFGELPHDCRFSDCRHTREPGCAVKAAVEAGDLPAHRHATYVRILEGMEEDEG